MSTRVKKVLSWKAAETRLATIKGTCEALQRGDQDEKLVDLKRADYMDTFLHARAIVEFCNSTIGREANSPLPLRYAEIYNYARQYSRSVAIHLLLRWHPPKATKQMLQEWLDKEKALPKIEVLYV